MAQFEVGGKCVCVEDAFWVCHNLPGDHTGPRRHEKTTICEIAERKNGKVYLSFFEYPSTCPTGESVGFDSVNFRPLESWPDDIQSAVEETVVHIHEVQPA